MDPSLLPNELLKTCEARFSALFCFFLKEKRGRERESGKNLVKLQSAIHNSVGHRGSHAASRQAGPQELAMLQLMPDTNVSPQDQCASVRQPSTA